MASAIDSGVDTGNDSNDSSAQEKLFKMDIENSDQPKPADIITDTPITKETDDQNNLPVKQSSSEIIKVESGPEISLTHLQPSSVIHGYEYHGPCIQGDTDTKKYILKYAMDSTDYSEFKRVFMAGGPFGTEYQEHPLMTKLRRGFPVRSRCCRTRSTAAYLKLKDNNRMCRAVCHNNTEAVRRYLEMGISPNCYDCYKRSPLHIASCMGYADMVKLLLDHGADPNAKDSIGNTPLHLAACTNHVNVITLLLQAGTRVTEVDRAGHSPLQLAITKFNLMKRSIMPHPVLKEQVCQVITMLTEYMKRKEGTERIDPELLNKFESLVRVSDSTEEVESNIRDLLSNLSSLSLSSPS